MEYRILQGDAWTYDAADGDRVTVTDGGETTSESTAAGGAGVAFTGLAPGRYWLALAPADATKPRVRLGVLVVEALADEKELELRREIAFLTERISKTSSLNIQVQNIEGSGVSRVGLPQLRRQRALAEVRLADYMRRKEGREPGGWR